MKTFQFIFIATLFVTLASSASVAENFDILFQSCFKFSNYSGKTLKDTFNEGFGKGYSYHYNCIADQVITLMAEGTKRLTGLNSNYIAEVLNGHNSPPFQSQYNCISIGLSEMQDEIRNARYWARMSRNCFKVPETIYKTCDEFSNFMLPQRKLLLDVLTPANSGYLKYIEIFKSIGMLDLFEKYINAVAVCNLEAVGIVASNFAHVDQQEGIDYVKGLTKTLSFPLSCISNNLDLSVKAVKTSYGGIVKGI